MLKIAIVGNIASGKSTVEKMLEDKGFVVYDTDKIAHTILASNKEIENEFGTLDRKEIAKIVFSDVNKLRLLESIIHPKVKMELEKIFKKDENIVFISVPQLFESGMNTLFDKIIFIDASEKIRLERLIKRNSLTEEDAMKRINSQKESNKREMSDFVIENNGNLEELQAQIDKVIELILV